jgi:hypothetical protein
MGAASVHGPAPFGSQLSIVAHHGIEDRGQHAPVPASIRAQPVQDELGDRGVADQVGTTQDLQVS